MIPMYRIAWRNEDTEFQGHGSPVFRDYDDCVREVAKLNRVWERITHWVEEVPLSEIPK